MTRSITYYPYSSWALAMPGIGLGTFGPDMSFIAASIFITSSVLKSYQGAAGSLLITMENLSGAIFVAVGGAIGTAVNNAQSTTGTSGGYGRQPSISLRDEIKGHRLLGIISRFCMNHQRVVLNMWYLPKYKLIYLLNHCKRQHSVVFKQQRQFDQYIKSHHTTHLA